MVYFRGEHGIRNFGDELNPYLWPRLLPGAFARDDATQFVGIGTLLNNRLPAAPRTVVFGAGVGYYGPPRRDDSWTIYCVRGPLSAKALELDASAAVTDPAMLLARVELPAAAPAAIRHAYIPHWQSAPDAWRTVCERIGIGFIDPRWPPDEVLRALRSVDVLIAEAMHGAIVADALRIPWVAARTHAGIKSFKWQDWCASVDVEYAPAPLPTIWPEAGDAGPVHRARRWAKLRLAGYQLARLVKHGRPRLSAAAVLSSRLDQLEERLRRLQQIELGST
jgi:succinoglycan biosynthesis protein ExoV